MPTAGPLSNPGAETVKPPCLRPGARRAARAPRAPNARGTILGMSGFGGIGGAENHGGVPLSGQGFSALQGRSDELRGDLARRRPPQRRWWQFWRRKT
jgi:hypothetical protein